MERSKALFHEELKISLYVARLFSKLLARYENSRLFMLYHEYLVTSSQPQLHAYNLPTIDVSAVIIIKNILSKYFIDEPFYITIWDRN